MTGSLMVISVNAWMQHPSGFRLVHGKAVDVHPLAALFGNSFLWNELVHMYVGAYIVTGFLLAAPVRDRVPARALGPLRAHRVRGAGDRGRDRFARCRSSIGDWVARDVATEQPTKLAAIEGLAHTTRGALRAPARLVRQRSDQVRHRDPQAALAAGLPQPQRHASRASTRCPPADRPPINITRVSFQLMVAIGTALALLGVVFLFVRCRRRRAARGALVLPRRGGGRAAVARRADRRLDRHRGRPPALGRLPA